MGKESKSTLFNASKLWKILENNLRQRNDFKFTKIALNTLLSNSYKNPTQRVTLSPSPFFHNYVLNLSHSIAHNFESFY
jgi:hypothetical protein